MNLILLLILIYLCLILNKWILMGIFFLLYVYQYISFYVYENGQVKIGVVSKIKDLSIDLSFTLNLR